MQVPQDGERIPRLADVIWLMNRGGGTERLWIELKTNFIDRSRTASPEAMAEAVMRVLKREKFLDRSMLVGFDWPALIAAKKIEPKVQCWFTTLPQSWFGDAPPPTEHGPPPKAELETLRAHGARRRALDRRLRPGEIRLRHQGGEGGRRRRLVPLFRRHQPRDA